MTGSFIFSDIIFTDSKSPGDEAGNPASIISTFNLFNCVAISSFSNFVSPIPADCSPSLKVVSKIRILLSLAIYEPHL